RMQVLQTPHSF
nr:immunoglobulin light chain junction region [Macaca mulatta]MPN90368.1 immunoglobulin light chain junction region [Macaca mulatta]